MNLKQDENKGVHTMPRNIIIKLLKSKSKEKLLKNQLEKKDMLEKNQDKFWKKPDFFSITMEVKIQNNGIVEKPKKIMSNHNFISGDDILKNEAKWFKTLG